MSNWSNTNPPPQGNLIPHSLRFKDVTVIKGGYVSQWPTLQFKQTVSEDKTIDFSECPFNYINLDSSSNTITLELLKVVKGHAFMIEYTGANNITVDIQDIGSVVLSTAGTYILVPFNSSVSANRLTNPSAT